MSDSSAEFDHLIHEICREHHTRARTFFHELGLYRGQPAILKLLWEQNGQTQTELATAMRVQPATVTKMIQRMEQAGFLERHPDPNDQRVSRVFLTTKAREVQSAVVEVCHRLGDEMLQGFTPEEQTLLRRFLIQVRDNLRHANAE